MADEKTQNPNPTEAAPAAPSAVESAPQVVDIDTLTVKLLILSASPHQFHSVGSFLTRRGWPTQVTGSMSEAIKLLTVEVPDFVLLSVNHTSPNIMTFPSLLAQTFNSTIVAFAEKTDHKTMGKLNSIRAPQKIMGPVSGPTIQRKLKLILADRYGLTKEESSRSSHSKDGDEEETREYGRRRKSKEKGNDVLRFSNDSAKGGYIEMNKMSGTSEGQKNPGFVHAKGQAIGDTSLLEQLLKEELEDEQKRPKASESEDADNLQTQSEDSADVNAAEQRSLEAKEGMALHAGNKSQTGHESGEKPPLSSEGPTIQSGLPNTQGPSLSSRAEGPEGGAVAGQDSDKGGSGTPSGDLGTPSAGANVSGSGSGSSASHLAPQSNENSRGSTPESTSGATAVNAQDASSRQQAGGQAQGAKAANDQESKELENEPSILSELDKKQKNELPEETADLVKVIQKAFAKSCAPAKNRIRHLTLVDVLVMMPVQTATLKGFFLVATSVDEAASRSFAEKFKTNLKSMMANEGLQGTVKDAQSVTTPSMLFVERCQMSVPFLISGENGDCEVALAFFNDVAETPQIQDSPYPEKSVISALDIDEILPVTFNAYIRLEENDKFVELLRPGSVLSAERQSRIIKRQVVIMIDNSSKDVFISYFYRSRLERAFNSEPSPKQKAG